MNGLVTLLEQEQYFEEASKLDIIKKYGTKVAITDFAILLGGFVSSSYYSSDGNNLENRTGYHWTRSSDNDGDVRAVASAGNRDPEYVAKRTGAVRPALLSSSICNAPNGVRGSSGILEIQYGNYPQQVAESRLSATLEQEYQSRRLNQTGKSYTTDSRKYNDYNNGFQAQQHQEYEYQGKKYVRVQANLYTENSNEQTLSDGRKVKNGDAVWVEVQPITWQIDERTKTALAKKCLVAGVRFYKQRGKWYGNWNNTEMKQFLETHFAKDMVASSTYAYSDQPADSKEAIEQAKKTNPYNFDFRGVSEEDIIRGSVESGVAVFLHGQSSEGKSARVKQLDPDLEIIYLRNATPDSLNGKSVYNPETGGMIDVPPTWYKKLKQKCDDESDKIHIVFFDEITNALPAIQGMAYNIVLDREVNGVWKLPDNARVVAAGNDYNDSLAANQLAESLFNRFAHVYIQTSVDDWLKWAMTSDNKREKLDFEEEKPERKIHPSVYAYIAFKREQALRSQYTGERPNADPRKWEMASLLLYKTGQPEMLRGLIGDDITRDFVGFCNQQVITLQDVLDDNYSDADFQMNTDQKWATTVGLSYVEDKDVEKVRGFVTRLNPELVAIFDSLWTHGDEKRLEKVAELRLLTAAEGYNPEGGKRR